MDRTKIVNRSISSELSHQNLNISGKESQRYQSTMDQLNHTEGATMDQTTAPMWTTSIFTRPCKVAPPTFTPYPKKDCELLVKLWTENKLPIGAPIEIYGGTSYIPYHRQLKAGKHAFEYHPLTKEYTYKGKRPAEYADQKTERLTDLLADYAVHLLDTIAAGITRYQKSDQPRIHIRQLLGTSPEQAIAKMQDLSRRISKHRKIFAGILAPMEECLKIWCKMRCQLNEEPIFDLSENVVEMMELLRNEENMDKRQRQYWELMLHTHTSKRLEALLAMPRDQFVGGQRSDEEIAWFLLKNKGDYKDIFIYYLNADEGKTAAANTTEDNHDARLAAEDGFDVVMDDIPKNDTEGEILALRAYAEQAAVILQYNFNDCREGDAYYIDVLFFYRWVENIIGATDEELAVYLKAQEVGDFYLSAWVNAAFNLDTPTWQLLTIKSQELNVDTAFYGLPKRLGLHGPPALGRVRRLEIGNERGIKNGRERRRRQRAMGVGQARINRTQAENQNPPRTRSTTTGENQQRTQTATRNTTINREEEFDWGPVQEFHL
ncbi:uncharacterized protein LY89DRAFT_691350 [Mollisia scopiformis]|uniref:Uncharacterized protein n=1 Tax=Mollisia scopiformis TaxID=149040 RepID=A0A132B7T5_MOLSC|nr:uncharacterized protein LY89DRAFT_691350 [Mollisia scopiformis]KUJ08049.1 hypothetical protein LY89DRAFT_691350 [Mollisia scopiformis]